MPWYWWGGKSEESDPAAALNPELKQFLKEQQPRPYIPADSHTSPPQSQPKPQPESKEPIPPTQEDQTVPPQSLYQDGRYAHLWKTYVPSSTIEAATTTPIDRIQAAKKERKQGIHRAALENCAFEEEIRQQCLSGQNMASRFKGTLTMCNDETKQYNRCYQLQAKFLQALGYMSTYDSTDDFEERIQMHADKLYHRMMDYEAAVDEAKRNHTPIPPLTSVFHPNRPAPTLEEMDMPQPMQARMKTPLSDLPPHERELAARAALQEAKIATSNMDEFHEYATTKNDERQRRQTMLGRIFGEPIAKFFIPDPENAPSKPDGSQRIGFDREIWREEKRTSR